MNFIYHSKLCVFSLIYHRYLEGIVSDLNADPTDPIWSLNMKKGLSSVVSFRIDKKYAKLSEEKIELKEKTLVDHLGNKMEYVPMFTRFEVSAFFTNNIYK